MGIVGNVNDVSPADYAPPPTPSAQSGANSSDWFAANAPSKSTQNVSTKTPPKDASTSKPQPTAAAPYGISAKPMSFLDRVTAPFVGAGSAYGNRPENRAVGEKYNPDAPLIDFNAAKAEDISSNPAVRGAIRGTAQVATDFTTPRSVELMAATGGLSKIPIVSKLVAGGFGLTQIKGALQRIPEFKKNLADGNYEDAAKVLTEMALGVEMGRRALNHAGSNTDTVSRPPEADTSVEPPPPPAAPVEKPVQNPPSARKTAPKATVPVVGPSIEEQQADAARADANMADLAKNGPRRKTPPWEARALADRTKVINQQQEAAAAAKTPVTPAPATVEAAPAEQPVTQPQDGEQSRLPLGASQPIDTLPEPKATAEVPARPEGSLGLQERPAGQAEVQRPSAVPAAPPKPEGALGLQERPAGQVQQQRPVPVTPPKPVGALGLQNKSADSEHIDSIVNSLKSKDYLTARNGESYGGNAGKNAVGVHAFIDKKTGRIAAFGNSQDLDPKIVNDPKLADVILRSVGRGHFGSEGIDLKEVFVDKGSGVSPEALANIKEAIKRVGELEPVVAPGTLSKPVGSLGLQDAVENPAPAAESPNAGIVRTVSTPKQTKAKVQWAISPAAKLNTSFGEGYEQDYQPRNTDTKSTAVRLMQRKGDMAFGAMADSYMAGDGAPITKLNDATGLHDAVTRNHGLEALKQLYNENSPRAEEYRKEVIDNSQLAGMTPEEVGRMHNPVLHRVLMENWDKPKIAEFAKEANQSSTARMSSAEIAKHMADKMTGKVMQSFDPSESGKPNSEFVRNLIEHLPIEEQNAFFDKNNELNQTGERAVRNAVFAKAYPNREAIERMAESTDDRVKNVTNGMLRAAPDVARMQDGIEKGDLHKLSIAEELGDAAQTMDELRTNKKNLQDWLDQEKIGGRNAIVERLVTIFMNESRRQRLIGDFIGNYAKAVEDLGSPKQESMFSQNLPTKEELLDEAYSEAKRTDEARRKTDPTGPSLGLEPEPVAALGKQVAAESKNGKDGKNQTKPR